MMFMTFGRWPVSISNSYDVTDGSGPDVRFSTSTAISTACGHQVELSPLPVKYDLVRDMKDMRGRSATPFS
eukprot:4788084-Prymnesium_polylepis.2